MPTSKESGLSLVETTLQENSESPHPYKFFRTKKGPLYVNVDQWGWGARGEEWELSDTRRWWGKA